VGYRLDTMAQQQLRVITEEEFAKHNTDKDCWTVVHGVVLNCTEEGVLADHPGGADVITVLAGKDSTSDFEDIAHSDAAREWCNKLIVGIMESATEEQKTLAAVPTIADLSKMNQSSKSNFFTVMLPAAGSVVLAGLAYAVMIQRRAR